MMTQTRQKGKSLVGLRIAEKPETFYSVAMNHKPVIGYPLDHETTPSYSKLPWYAIRENYFTSTSDLGATAIGIPYDIEALDHYLSLIDALVVIGGDFDIDPALYGDHSARHERIMLKESRTAFEWAITQRAIDMHMPILGICGGQQLLAVVLGGSLIQHIPDVIDSDIKHEQPNPRNEVGHSVKIKPDTLLHRIVGIDEIGVNSAHHQAVKAVPETVTICGSAPDGVIEAIELPNHPFCLGVQWHPEYHVTQADDKIWHAFIDAAKTYQQTK